MTAGSSTPPYEETRMVSLIAGSASPTRLLFSGISMGFVED
jgi:hypothetical protein